MWERGAKAEKEMRQMEAERESKANEQEKANKKSLKKMDRDAQKREQSRINKTPKGQSAFGSTYTIQQPKSKGS